MTNRYENCNEISVLLNWFWPLRAEGVGTIFQSQDKNLTQKIMSCKSDSARYEPPTIQKHKNKDICKVQTLHSVNIVEKESTGAHLGIL